MLAITNVMGSQATRDADGVLFTRAGLEIGVAATKTSPARWPSSTSSACASPSCAAPWMRQRIAELVAEVKRLPHCIAQITGPEDGSAGVVPLVGRIAAQHWQGEFFLYIGRHVGLPVALEGALKLKEISYIATDAYAAGEMKHGPIALLDESTPWCASPPTPRCWRRSPPTSRRCAPVAPT